MMSDDDESYHGEMYWRTVKVLATFIHHRTQAGDGATADRLLEAFCTNVREALAAPEW